jgi:hypothetical protein
VQTREKAARSPHLLIVDGHNSHFLMEFLGYGQANEIIVICYPSHTTHILQGLNVVTFATLKKCWTLARDEWEQANYPVKLTKRAISEGLQLNICQYHDTFNPQLLREDGCCAIQSCSHAPAPDGTKYFALYTSRPH